MNESPKSNDHLSYQNAHNMTRRKAYWLATIKLTAKLLVIWFLVSYGAGILLRGFLDNFYLGGAPLGFWFAQNGAIYIFVALIFYYCHAQSKIEKEFQNDKN